MLKMIVCPQEAFTIFVKMCEYGFITNLEVIPSTCSVEITEAYLELIDNNFYNDRPSDLFKVYKHLEPLYVKSLRLSDLELINIVRIYIDTDYPIK